MDLAELGKKAFPAERAVKVEEIRDANCPALDHLVFQGKG